MVGIFPIYLAPTGNQDRGLGNGSYQLFLSVWLQKSWDNWTTYGGGGYWINHASDTKNNWFFGWLVERQLSDQWTLGAELFHRTEELAGQGASSGFNIGGSFNRANTITSCSRSARVCRTPPTPTSSRRTWAIS
jgi:hypothetical protein